MQNPSEYLEGWPWQPDLCPADEDFIDWMDYRLAEGADINPIFHMGTGMHHKVGKEAVLAGLTCVGITASEQEFMVGAQGLALDGEGHYALIHANIYQINTKLLNTFRVMNLFHLGEMENIFGPIPYEDMDKLIERVLKGGYVLFYPRSSAWDRTVNYVRHCVDIGLLGFLGNHRSLEVYTKL